MARHNLSHLLAIFALALAVLAATPAFAIPIDTVRVGNASPLGFRGLDVAYRLGTYEVTNAQYAEFLNAVDPLAANPLNLYFDPLATAAVGGIIRNLGTGYTLKPGQANQPILAVSWYSAARFTNWLHNGQGAADTESGAYTLLGGTPIPTNATTITRNPTAQWFLPTLDEWDKAAYHKNDGVSPNFWTYPTQSDTPPSSDQPPGTDAPDPTNVANIFRDDGLANNYNDGWAVTANTDPEDPFSINYLTDVGAYSSAPSPYGTFDQGGNVEEWLEDADPDPTHRASRGGTYGDSFSDLSIFAAGPGPLASEAAAGFRVAAILHPGDVNLDGQVNGLDANLVSANWLITNPTYAQGDANDDGQINGLDANIVSENWLAGASAQPSATPANPTPEPATIVLAMISLLFILFATTGRSAARARHAAARTPTITHPPIPAHPTQPTKTPPIPPKHHPPETSPIPSPKTRPTTPTRHRVPRR